MSIGRDVRERSVVMRPAPVLGGLEPELLDEGRQALEQEAATRAAAYVPEWTGRGPDDAGLALLRVGATLAQAAHRRLNRLPRRLVLDYLHAAGVRPMAGTPAAAMAAIEIADDAEAPIEVPEGSVFTTPEGSALETETLCSAVPGRLAALAVFTDGWLVLDRLQPPYDLQPFGAHPQVSAELWVGLETPVVPRGTLCFGVELMRPVGLAIAEAVAQVAPDDTPLIRWEAMTATGAVELAVDFDDTGGLSRPGVIGLRVPALDWPTRLRPAQITGTPLRWLRARLVTASFKSEHRLAQVVLNGVAALAARSIRDEVVEPVERLATTGARYRLALVPVLPGSIELEITGIIGGLGSAEVTGTWSEVPSLADAQPDDQVFVLDPATGTLTFGDGLHGRAVPDGYRNVLARQYRVVADAAPRPRQGDLLPPEISVADLTGLRVVSITTGSDGEGTSTLLRRGPGVIRSRMRAVAAADYATAALATPGVEIARAHCLPGIDSPGALFSRPGSLGVVVVPRVAADGERPVPDMVTLQAVADHLARITGVVGARVVAVEPTYRRVAVHGLLVGAVGADLARLVSTARDRIDEWLDPLVGGDGTGWGFGARVRWHGLVRMLLERVLRLEAISQVSFRLDGRQLPECTDVVLRPGELVWPDGHLLEAVPSASRGAS
jgi:predicted phage baseplate assembly protein